MGLINRLQKVFSEPQKQIERDQPKRIDAPQRRMLPQGTLRIPNMDTSLSGWQRYTPDKEIDKFRAILAFHLSQQKKYAKYNFYTDEVSKQALEDCRRILEELENVK